MMLLAVAFSTDFRKKVLFFKSRPDLSLFRKKKPIVSMAHGTAKPIFYGFYLHLTLQGGGPKPSRTED